MEQAALQLRQMTRTMERLQADPGFTGSEERLQQMERLQARLRGTMEEMEQMQIALRAMIGQP